MFGLLHGLLKLFGVLFVEENMDIDSNSAALFIAIVGAMWILLRN